MIDKSTTPHMFMPGETIEAIIKKVNRHDVEPLELKILMICYRQINGDDVPRAGTHVKIPMLSRHISEGSVEAQR